MHVGFKVVRVEGQQNYDDMLSRQLKTWQSVKDGVESNTMFLLEHSPVVTLGRRTKKEHLLLSEEEFEKKGIAIAKVDRGGSATYHGPGQLVGYIICKVSSQGGTRKLVENTLEMVTDTIKYFGVDCEPDEDNPGVWTKGENPRKLAAVGMHIKEGYSLHGFAINIDMSLLPFTYIVPCGLTLPVSTISLETGKRHTVAQVATWIEENWNRYLR